MHIHLPEWYTDNVPWLFATRAARSFSQAMLVIVVPLYVAAAGYSTLQVGYLLSIALAGSTGMTILVGVLSDRYGRKPLLMIIAGLAAIGSAVYALTTQFWVLALMAALASIRGGGAGSGGGGRVLTFHVIEKTGEVAAARVVTQTQQLMIISAEGIVINTPVKEKDPTKGGISVQHRTTQGVQLMRLDPGDKVVSITCFEKTE